MVNLNMCLLSTDPPTLLRNEKDGSVKDTGGQPGAKPAAGTSSNAKAAAKTSSSVPMSTERVSSPPKTSPAPSKDSAKSSSESVGDALSKKKKGKEREPASTMSLRVHPVNFEVANSAKPLKFLQDLLVNILKVDPTASILPQPNANPKSPELKAMSDFPHYLGAKNLVFQYIAGLDTTPTMMKGKVWLQCHAKLQTFKKNEIFKRWIAGSGSSPRIQLDRSTLNTVVRAPVGLFFNTVTRFDLVESLEDRIQSTHFLASKIKGVEPSLPPFQIEAKLLHRNKQGSAKFFRMLADRDHVKVLRTAMGELFNSLSGDVCFIPFDVWKSLTSAKKNEYFQAQRMFNETHNAIKLYGLKNSTSRIKTADGVCSVREWITNLQASDKARLFHKVHPSVNGVMEIWYNVSFEKEVKTWLKSAIVEIGLMAETGQDTANCSSLDEIFVDVDKARQRMQAAKHYGGHLHERRKEYMTFDPVKAISSQGPAKTRTPRRRPKKMKLVYDSESDTDNTSPMSDLDEVNQRPLFGTPLPRPGVGYSPQSARNLKTAFDDAVPSRSSVSEAPDNAKAQGSPLPSVPVSTVVGEDDDDEMWEDCADEETAVPSNVPRERTWANVVAGGVPKEHGRVTPMANASRVASGQYPKSFGRGGGIDYRRGTSPNSTVGNSRTVASGTGGSSKAVNRSQNAGKSQSKKIMDDEVFALKLAEKDDQIRLLMEAVSSLQGQLASLLAQMSQHVPQSMQQTPIKLYRTTRRLVKRRCLRFSSPSSASPSVSLPDRKKPRGSCKPSCKSNPSRPSDEPDSDDEWAAAEENWDNPKQTGSSEDLNDLSSSSNPPNASAEHESDEWADGEQARVDLQQVSTSKIDVPPSSQKQEGAGSAL